MNIFLLTVKIGKDMWSFILLILMTACSFLDGDHDMRSAKDKYKLSFNSVGWEKINSDQSDYAWLNKSDGRIFLSNSFCDKYKNYSLSQMAKENIQSINEGKILSEKKVLFMGQDAIDIEGEGIVDGVKVHLKALNTKRDYCYYDFISIAPNSVSTHNHEEFNSFLNHVVFK